MPTAFSAPDSIQPGSSDLKKIGGTRSAAGSRRDRYPTRHRAGSPPRVTAVGCHQGGDRHEVVRVGGVPQTQRQRDPERDQDRGPARTGPRATDRPAPPGEIGTRRKVHARSSRRPLPPPRPRDSLRIPFRTGSLPSTWHLSAADVQPDFRPDPGVRLRAPDGSGGAGSAPHPDPSYARRSLPTPIPTPQPTPHSPSLSTHTLPSHLLPPPLPPPPPSAEYQILAAKPP